MRCKTNAFENCSAYATRSHSGTIVRFRMWHSTSANGTCETSSFPISVFTAQFKSQRLNLPDRTRDPAVYIGYWRALAGSILTNFAPN